MPAECVEGASVANEFPVIAKEFPNQVVAD